MVVCKIESAAEDNIYEIIIKPTFIVHIGISYKTRDIIKFVKAQKILAITNEREIKKRSRTVNSSSNTSLLVNIQTMEHDCA